jgi:nucleotide-binding universal stress UspA family protein
MLRLEFDYCGYLPQLFEKCIMNKTEVPMPHTKIALALPLEEKLLDPLYHWGKRFDWSEVKEVHMIHVVKKNITPLEFGLVEMPDEKTFRELEPTLHKFMGDEAKKIIPSDFKGKILIHVSRDFNAADEVIKELKKAQVSLIVVSTRGKHGFEGLFHSSFTDQMVKFAPCDVYVVRPV